MDFSGNLVLGPFTIALRYVAIAACIAAALALARIPLGRRRFLGAKVIERLVNGVVIFALGWKATPAILHPAELFRDPIPLLMAAPGIPGLVIGFAASAAYVAVALLRPRRLRRASLFPLLVFAGVVAAGVGVTQLAVSQSPPGPPAATLSLPTLDGGVVSIESFRGRVVIVNFWATWCPPCRAELPALASFARNTGTTNAVLLTVNQASMEKSDEDVRAFAGKYGLDAIVALDRTGAAAKAWGVQAYPTTFVIDPRGRVNAQRTGAVDGGWLRRETRAAARRQARP